jgi:hypothetical protein
MRVLNPFRAPRRVSVLVAVLVSLSLAPAFGQWVEFTDETNSRAEADPARFSADPEEKAYTWGDFDRDGDLDLAISRKQPFTSPGKRVNVLMMNQGGVLTDRTADFAVDTNVAGDFGFNTPTNDRDITVADVNLDGWLDLITSAAINTDDPPHIGYPRVYMNKCCSVGGCGATTCSPSNWQGFRYEYGRIPTMLSDSGQAGFNPCFCSVNAGDVSGDGYPDLYFVDYDTSCGGGGSPQDFNDKLLINKGAAQPGYFQDVTETNFVAGAAGFPVSAFGASGGIAKFDDDGVNDILKQFAGSVQIAYNSATPGVFDQANGPYGGAAYFVSHGDLNNDGKIDLAVSDDGADRYLLHQGVTGGMANFVSFAYSFQHNGTGGPAADDGFGGNNIIADLDKDGWRDVIVTDNDVDVGGCTRRAHIYRNLTGQPGGNVTLQEQTTGTGCANFNGNPATCLVTTIPSDKLEGTHDVAVFDINGDTYPDLVVGRCSGTEIYMNVPDLLPSGSVPDGDNVPGSELLLAKSGSQLQLSWGASCNADDTDYVVYRGAIGDYDSHVPAACSTAGATTFTLPLSGGFDTPLGYYVLIAPRYEEAIGSLGQNSNGGHRPSGPSPCAPHIVGACN